MRTLKSIGRGQRAGSDLRRDRACAGRRRSRSGCGRGRSTRSDCATRRGRRSPSRTRRGSCRRAARSTTVRRGERRRVVDGERHDRVHRRFGRAHLRGELHGAARLGAQASTFRSRRPGVAALGVNWNAPSRIGPDQRPRRRAAQRIAVQQRRVVGRRPGVVERQAAQAAEVAQRRAGVVGDGERDRRLLPGGMAADGRDGHVQALQLRRSAPARRARPAR